MVNRLTCGETVEPDSFPDGQLASNFNPHVVLSAVGSDSDGRVGVFVDTANSTGTKKLSCVLTSGSVVFIDVDERQSAITDKFHSADEYR